MTPIAAGEGIIRDQAHERRHDARHQAGSGQRRGKARPLTSESWHASKAQDGRIHKNNVCHHHKGGDSRQDLCANCCTSRLQCKHLSAYYKVFYMAQLLKNLGGSYQQAAFVSDHLDERQRQE
jgi:hypothetical protein